MNETRVPLYERLPEIYKIRDEEVQTQENLPQGPLRAYLSIVEQAFGSIHANIEALYDDLFIETAADWVTPYIGDLMGTSHLSGDPWTLRADVADSIALRRRKGTLGALELLTFNLTRWGVRCVELRENLAWAQHLNHQRPDIGGPPPYGQPNITRNTPRRGGTIALRDPALLSLLRTPFDPFAYTADVKPHVDAAIRYNIPNLAIFLWRLESYRIPLSAPSTRAVQAIAAPAAGEAAFVVRFDVFPLDRPVVLFNVRRATAQRRLDSTTTISLTEPDEAPGPILPARLTDDSEAGNSAAYVTVNTYDPTQPANLVNIQLSGHALQLHVPEAQFAGVAWQFRGANLCAWEDGLDSPVLEREVVIDPVIGRVAVGVATVAEGNALRNQLLLTFTYGAVGPVGAHPISRSAAPTTLDNELVDLRAFSFFTQPNGLRDSLNNLQNPNLTPGPVVIEIQDSMAHDLDLAAVAGTVVQNGGPNLQLNHSVIIRAAEGCRPIVRLAQPVRLGPVDPANADLTVRLEGLFVTRGTAFPADQPLIARAAVNALEIEGCTLDPAHFRQRDGSLTPILNSMALRDGYGFPAPTTFDQTPDIRVHRSITGPLHIDEGYRLEICDSIIDGGRGVADEAGNAFAVSSATAPVNGWGPPTTLSGATFFGRMRVREIDGRGGIWVHALEVLNNQTGCIKYSYFEGLADRLPQNHACVDGTDARLRFVSEDFGDPAYGQLKLTSDFRILERGPNDDQMGAFGFLMEAHKWRNLQIRYREFMPVGVRPLLIPVT
jgi:hypothetical protein